jgi:hypothetical protein
MWPLPPLLYFPRKGSGYICGKKVKWKKDEREKQKGGLEGGRLPPYLA